MKGIIARGMGMLVALVFVLAGAQAVPAAYIGPIRATYPDERNEEGDFIVLYRTPDSSGGLNECTLNTHCETNPSWEQQHYWCGGGPLYPSGYCSAHPGTCWKGTVWIRHCDYIPGSEEPAATVSGTASCATPGTNGWCRGNASVALSANDPLGSHVITWIEGNQGGSDFALCDPADAKSVNCTWPAGDGQRTLNFWAHSSKGDTSQMSSVGLSVDSTNPTGSLTVSEAPNAAGWYRGATVTANGSDSLSGVAGRWVQVNGGAQQASPVSLYTSGIYTVNGVVRDNAGNQIATAPMTLNVDTVAPTVTVILDRAPDGAAWYMGPVTVDVSGTDDLSGFSHSDYNLITGAGGVLLGTMPVTITTEGTNDLNLSSYDVAGNERKGSYPIRIDLTAPNAGLAVNGTPGNNGWYVSPVDLLVNASDSGSGVCSRSLRVDVGAWESAPLNDYEGQGTHSFVGQSQDCVGRDSPVTSALSFKVDTEKPSMETTTPGPDGRIGWYITPFELSVTGTDATSGLALAQSRISGGTWDSNPVLVDIEGYFNVEYRTVDHAGNEMLSIAGVKVDLSDPSLSLSEAGTLGDNGWYVSPVVVEAVVSDAVSGMRSLQMRLNEGAWATTASLTLSTDGEHQVDARADDNAGRDTETGVDVRIDQTQPTIDSTIEGTMGNNNWYVTPVTLKANAADVTSGLASVLPAAEIVVEDTASYTPEWTVRDNAGHEINETLAPIKVDATAPAIGFDPEDDILIGIVTLSGRARDALSGLVKVDVSVNGGVTWTEVSVNPDGTWEMPFNTLLFPGGNHLVRARAEDEAGNVTVVDMNTVIGNKEPQIDISDRWLVWENGILEIQMGDTGYEGVKVGVCDYEKRWPCVEWEYMKGDVPEKVTWDGYFGKVYAPAGEYRVWATIWDAYGRNNMDQGTIIIPPPSTGTPTPTMTTTPTPTQTGTVEPAPTQGKLEATATLQPAPTATPFVPVPVKPNIPVKWTNLGPYLVLVGFCFALGASVSRDRRPREWRRLAEQLSKMNDIQKKKGD